MFKKAVAIVVLTAMTIGTVQARDITLSFADGSTHQYLNTPEHVTPEQVIQRAAKDFPNKTLINVDGGRRDAQTPAEEDSWLPVIGKVLLGVVVVGALVYAVRHMPVAQNHPCVLPTDRDARGYLCGGRASSVRPGGA